MNAHRVKPFLFFPIALLWYFICLPFSATAQTGKYYTTDEGLTSSLINQIFQDSRGYIWVATEYGLSRFDGNRFVNYHQLSHSTVSIKSSYVRTLYETDDNVFLVGCIDGLMRYCPQTDTFSEVRLWRNNKQVYPHITKIAELSTGNLWISTSGQGMFQVDLNKNAAHSLDKLLGDANYNFQSVFYEDSNGVIWIGTEGSGLISYQPRTSEISFYAYPYINDNSIAGVLEDNHGNLFIGTQRQGLSRYDRLNNKFVEVPHIDNKKLSVYCLEMLNNEMLIGTDGQGVMYYDPIDRKVKDYIIDSAPFNLRDVKVHSILLDDDDNLWLGLFQKGVVLLPHQDNEFAYMGSKSLHYNPIGSRCVMSMYQTRDGHLWVGTDNEGVYELTPDGKRINHFLLDHKTHSLGNTVMGIFEDSQNNMWIGSYIEGLMRLDRTTGKFDAPLKIQSEKVMSIVEDKNSNLFIATLGAGVYQYNLKSKAITHYQSAKDESGDVTRNELANDWVNALYCASDGLIWIGHYKGVSCLNPKTASFLEVNNNNTPISGGVGYSLHEDREGVIWAGTSNGLLSLNRTTGMVNHYTTANGLPNNIVCGILEDGEQNLWLSSYKGISKLERNRERFINYYAGDGLQGNEFTHGAYCKGVDGRLYFGGVNGITYFYPNSINVNPKEKDVLITDFYLFDTAINKNSKSNGKPIIFTSVEKSNIFQLTHRDNTFSIVFSTLQYNNTEQILYQYKIDELGQKWLATQPGQNRVTYNNLPPGRYTFSVRAVNHGEYSSARTISIIIIPPWYQTWWANCLYACLIVLLIYGVVLIVKSRMLHKKEMMQRDQINQINEAKLQFFINISHEIRTPMTLIINPIEKLLRLTEDPQLHNTYAMIYRNSQRILRLINQLMDVRKIDKGQMQMKFSSTDIVMVIQDIMATFDYAAVRKNIDFQFMHEDSELLAWVDQDNFDKILINILSNAFKYTDDNGEIKVILSTGTDINRTDALANYFQIVVSDTGIGIDEDKMEAIFDRFYQVDSDKAKVNSGTGIGLHLCRSLVKLHHGVIFAENRHDGKGCRFVVKIPLGMAHIEKVNLLADNSAARNKTNILDGEYAKGDLLETKLLEEKSLKNKSKHKIMVVEDETEIQDYLKQELSPDYKVTICKNGKEAYEMMLKDAPDLVISDVMMPEMDGFTLCRRIKQNTNINHLPVILLTARSSSDDKLEGIELGADAYLVKPFNTELLRRTIDNLIVNRKLLQNKFSGAQEQEDKMDKLDMKSPDEMLMEKVMKIINTNLSNPDFNVEMLAAEVGMSRVHIYRKLKELTSLTARDFIRNIRLQQAANLLKNDKKLTVSDVAYATGHTNLSHFSNSFKSKYGMSPSDYSLSKRE